MNQTVQPPDTPAKDPDQLLIAIGTSHFGRGMTISLLAHVLIIALTSFGLYKDWATYGMFSPDKGFHTPSDIKTIRKERFQAAERAEEEAKLEKRIAEQKAAAEADAEAAPTATPEAADARTGQPPVAPTIQPLPPASLDSTPGLLDDF